MLKNILIIIFSVLLFNHISVAQEIKISGAMKNVMRNGELQGTIFLDTILPKKHLYAIGPLENLKGEITVLNGISYVSKVREDGAIEMNQTFDVKAPFLVYAHNATWDSVKVPDYIEGMHELEKWIDEYSEQFQRPFVFLLKGKFEEVFFHIQNLPDGTVVRSPQDAHQGQGKYRRFNTEGTFVGFFSKNHHTIFTHHDSDMHVHYLSNDELEMGHVDDLKLNNKYEVYFYFPKISK